MLVSALHTPVLASGDDIVALLKEGGVSAGDIVVLSSKAMATVEGRVVACDDFEKLVEEETARMHGRIIRSSHGVLLTELQPDGMDGTFLVPNAGLDRSNVAEGYAVGWPQDPVATVKRLREGLGAAIILSDSGLSPRRRGVVAFAIACAGIDPIQSLIGTPDLFGKDMRYTEEAVADQLATMGNTVMGNSDQSVPAAIIRDHGIPMTDYCGWVPGIERERDLYHGVI